MKMIEGAWRSYSKMVVPGDAGPIQIKDTRQAFFAGAAVLFTIMTGETLFDEGKEVTAADMDKLQMLRDEIDLFGASLDIEVLDITKH